MDSPQVRLINRSILAGEGNSFLKSGQPQEPPREQTHSHLIEKRRRRKNIEICHKNIAITRFADMLLDK